MVGTATLTTTSAPQASSAEPTEAPASEYSLSGCPALSPAPDSTRPRCRSPVSELHDVGDQRHSALTLPGLFGDTNPHASRESLFNRQRLQPVRRLTPTHPHTTTGPPPRGTPARRPRRGLGLRTLVSDVLPATGSSQRRRHRPPRRVDDPAPPDRRGLLGGSADRRVVRGERRGHQAGDEFLASRNGHPAGAGPAGARVPSPGRRHRPDRVPRHLRPRRRARRSRADLADAAAGGQGAARRAA